MFKNLQSIDLGIIVMYFVLIFGVALYVYLRRKRQTKGSATEGYFLGGKDLSWIVVGASLFASNIGSEHLIGLAGQGASGDFVAGQFELLASLILLLLGWFFVPFYLRSGVFTMPGFLARRYDQWAKSYLSWVSIVAYVITKISVTIIAGGIVVTALLGINFWVGAVIIVLFTGIYTIIGGLKVVVLTDAVQMVILLAGSIGLTYFGLQELGGWDALVSVTTPEHLSLWRGIDDPDFPWTGILFGAPILGVWYWCTDQFIVQRVISAKNLDHARKGTIFGGFLKLLPLFLFVLPGVIAFALSQSPDASFEFPVVKGKVQYDQALPLLTLNILPAGMKGLVIAGILAALMSSLSSVFNSCSTLFTMDIYRKYKPDATPKRLVYVGQIATVVLVGLGLAWIPLMELIEGGLFQKLQSIQAYISPPIAAVFLIGIFSRKITSKAAKYSLLTGAVLGTSRLVLELVQQSLKAKGSSLPSILASITEINFLHFAVVLFVICTVVLLVTSKEKDAKPLREIESITYSKKVNVGTSEPLNLALSIILVICVVALWVIFR